MRYEDASQTGSMTSDVNARDDTDHLAGNDFGPATGNLITGSGTVSGAAGTDLV
jgi:large repetitive protein